MMIYGEPAILVPVRSRISVYIQRTGTLVSEDDFGRFRDALQKKLDTKFSPAWGVGVNLAPPDAQVPPDSSVNGRVIRGYLDDYPPLTGAPGGYPPNAGGFHLYDKSGPYFRAAVQGRRPDGSLLIMMGRWEKRASHEIFEAAMDLYANLFVDLGGYSQRLEVSDAVNNQQDADGLADAVTPAWYVRGSAGPWDIDGVLTGPLTTDGSPLPQ